MKNALVFSLALLTSVTAAVGASAQTFVQDSSCMNLQASEQPIPSDFKIEGQIKITNKEQLKLMLEENDRCKSGALSFGKSECNNYGKGKISIKANAGETKARVALRFAQWNVAQGTAHIDLAGDASHAAAVNGSGFILQVINLNSSSSVTAVCSSSSALSGAGTSSVALVYKGKNQKEPVKFGEVISWSIIPPTSYEY